MGGASPVIRLGFDARLSYLPGVGRYIQCLLSGLVAFRDELEVIVYIMPESPIVDHGWPVHTVPVSPYTVAEQVYLPYRVAQDRVDIFHTPHYPAPLATPSRLVVTIHDLVYFRFPPLGASGTRDHAEQALRRIYYVAMNHLASLRADAIITVSEFTRTEVKRYLLASTRKVSVVPNAANIHMQRQPEEARRRFMQRQSLDTPYILYVGTNKPWKNLQLLLAAFAEASSSLSNWQLVVAGKQGRNEERVHALIERHNESGRVIALGEVAETDMPALYSAAEVVVCPSLYEGFGLSALEAMACGVPVLASTAASLPEVVGDAALSADPHDQDAWTAAMIDLHQDPELRHRLAQAGLERARTFSVQRMAQTTMAIYRQLARPRTRIVDA
jgi:glycosyltransferase involved in cell wall biosynthesis